MPEQKDPSQANNVPPKLQALGFSELLDTTFSFYRTHFWSFLRIAAGYFIAMLIGVSILFFDDSLGRGAKIIVWVPTIITIFGVSVLVVSAFIFAVGETYLGKPIRMRTVLGQAVRQFRRCFVGSLILGLVGGLLLVCLLIIFALFSYLLGRVFPGTFVQDSLSVTVISLSYVLTAACITVSFVGYWCFYILATYMEALPMWNGLKRSGELGKGRRWRIIGIVLAISLLSFAIGFILRILFAFLLVLIGLEGVGNFRETVQWMALWELPTKLSELRLSYALMYLINLGIDTFTMPIWVIGFTRLYFDQRIRKEGFDIEVMATHRGG